MPRILLLLLLSTLSPALSQTLKKTIHGTYPVGFRSSLELDFSRPSRINKHPGRAIQINVWYPAEPGSKKLTLRDYVRLAAHEDSSKVGVNEGAHAVAAFLDDLRKQGTDVSAWTDLLNKAKPMKAGRDAARIEGEFPVVQLIHGSPLIYSVMGEWLASRGMIVINVPYKGFLQNQFDVSVAGMETEMRDNEFAFDFIAREFQLSSPPRAIVGYSFGGQSAVGMAVRSPDVRGIVSLDGGIGSTFGPQLLAGHPFYSLEKVTFPILHLYNPADTGGNIDWFSTTLYNENYLVAFKNMDHSFFGLYGLLDNEIPHVLGPDKSRPGNNAEAVLLYTGRFLSEVFEPKPSGTDVLSPLSAENPWLNDCVLSVTWKKREFMPYNIDELHGFLEKGFDALLAARNERKKITRVPITDASYRQMFLEQFNSQQKEGMQKIAEMYSEDFPQSALAWYYKGRAAMMSGGEAKVYFEKCLELLTTDSAMSDQEKETVKGRVQQFIR
jgi:dienelactone hydrolase